MTWFQDLTPCSYFGDEYSSFLRAVGWLERGKAFAGGTFDSLVYIRLCELGRNPWQPLAFAGSHACSICQYEGERGSGNLFIPGDGIVFVCPELIVHYMNAHCCAPPQEFCRMVLACPPMRSMQYFKALLANGARPLLRDTVHRGGI